MRIQELSKRLHVTPRAIRLYEQAGLLRPLRERSSGYRVYTEDDAWQLQTVVSLRELGLGLQAIRELLDTARQERPGDVRRLLELQRMALTAKWTADQEALAAIDDLIARTDGHQAFGGEELFRLADRLRDIQRSRAAWRDRWRFDDAAADYDAAAARYAAGPRIAQRDYEAALDFVAQWVAPRTGEIGLDVGAGTGNLTGLLLQRGADMHAVDQSAEMLDRCRSKYPSAIAKLGNALSIPYWESRFDFAVSAFALHHLDGAQQRIAWAEMDRVLKPHGRICIAGLMTNDEDAALLDPETQDVWDGRCPTDRSALLDWLRERGYVTVQHRLAAWVHIVYGVRRH